MDVDRNGLEVLERDHCLALMRSVPLGSIGLSLQALPVVLPVNFVLDPDHERVLVRTSDGAKLRAALDGVIVAFEVDHIDPISHTGWSVLVQGSSTVVTDPAEIERARRLPLRPWASDLPDHWVAISIDRLSGRRIGGWYRPGATMDT